jgi:predicted ABC-type transport system involved in lysophospholipase L1 biosynthesis ATPase subunit
MPFVVLSLDEMYKEVLGWDLFGGGVDRASLRARRLGIVFQFYHLLPELDVLENVWLPAMNFAEA